MENLYATHWFEELLVDIAGKCLCFPFHFDTYKERCFIFL